MIRTAFTTYRIAAICYPEMVAMSRCSILTPSADDLDVCSPKPDVSGGDLLFKNALTKVTR
ncbi:MAG: hypothetical protein WCR04_09465 [Fibrobacteraceae bacterium]